MRLSQVRILAIVCLVCFHHFILYMYRCSERCLFYAVITYYLYGGQLQPALGCSFLPFIEDHRVALGCCFHLRSEGCVLDVFPISSLYSILNFFFKFIKSCRNMRIEKWLLDVRGRGMEGSGISTSYVAGVMCTCSRPYWYLDRTRMIRTICVFFKILIRYGLGKLYPKYVKQKKCVFVENECPTPVATVKCFQFFCFLQIWRPTQDRTTSFNIIWSNKCVLKFLNDIWRLEIRGNQGIVNGQRISENGNDNRAFRTKVA